MATSNESQNVIQVVNSPLNGCICSLGSFTFVSLEVSLLGRGPDVEAAGAVVVVFRVSYSSLAIAS